MKRLTIGWVLLCVACGTASTETAPPDISPAAPPAAVRTPTLLDRFSPRMRLVLQTDTGLVRGFTPGEPLDSVMRRETAVLHEDSLTYKGYLLGDSLSTDVMDVRYFFNAKSRRTDSLVIDTYSEADSLVRELNRYFTARFGEAARKTPKRLVWRLPESEILVRDVGIQKAPGLQIVARRRK